MTQDPIVQEIQEIRDRIAREHDYDIDAIFETLRKAEASSGREHVTLRPRSIPSGVCQGAGRADPELDWTQCNGHQPR